VKLFFLFVFLPLLAAGADYHLDSTAGDDSNPGTSPAKAWRTLGKVNATVFHPGDRVLLHSGGSWTGTLHPQGSGAENAPIVLDRYGEGATPVVHGNGDEAALLLDNQEYWDIRNLEFTNDAAAEGLRRGVLVRASNVGRALHHIHLSGLHVHNVKGKLGADIVSKTTGGIAIEVRGTERPSRFDDVLIENCKVEHVDNTGIYNWSDFSPHPRDPRWEELRFTRVVVRGNTLSDIGKNAMGIRASLAPLIERNIVRNSSARLHGNAIYVFGCKGALLQYNDVSGTRFDRIEGAAYDSDYNSEDTVIQFNYSSSNGGGLVDLCNNSKSSPPRGYNDGTVVRNNISRNETDRVIGFDGKVTNALIENNSIYVGPGLSPHIVEFDLFGKVPGYADRVTFRGNVIVNEGSGTYLWGGATNVVFENNALSGKQPDNAPPTGDFEFRPAVVFATKGDTELKADLYLPKGSGPFPGVVYIHGGGWSGGERTQLRRQAAYFAGRGIAGVAIDYRLSGQAKYPAALEDCKDAVGWIRANAARYKIDGTRLAAAGSSAGGHLAALLGLTANSSERVSAVVALNAVLDLTGMGSRGTMVSRFLGQGCEEAPALCREASPLYRTVPGAPPFLILHGTADQTVPYSQATEMAGRLKAAGVPVELFTAESGPHTFWANPRWTAQTLETMDRFLRNMLEPK
jgi:acetyl esterase/lipase